MIQVEAYLMVAPDDLIYRFCDFWRLAHTVLSHLLNLLCHSVYNFRTVQDCRAWLLMDLVSFLFLELLLQMFHPSVSFLQFYALFLVDFGHVTQQRNKIRAVTYTFE